ncbi:hypothetical protein ACC696_38780, partial [Rhizobium ruizarguesonis]
HVFGVSPEGRLFTDLTVALARVPRGLGEGSDARISGRGPVKTAAMSVSRGSKEEASTSVLPPPNPASTTIARCKLAS